ncbi:MAG: gluconate transporter [Flavobacteriaceae bacterium]|nr:gluconate transporter [Flavobacteriaceae bacterium]
MDYQLLLAILIGIIVLLVLILRFKLQAFIALLIAAILVGVIAGMPPLAIIESVKSGMGSTLGFVAVVVGLGAMFGAILEHSGGAEALASYLLKKFGSSQTSTALTLTGFFVAIPVFFDVGFIILVPLIYSLQRKTGKSLLLYGIPLLAGLAVTHAFIPPTPGPVAVADILSADLGWVIVLGFIAGLPAALISGPLFGRYIAKRIHVNAPELIEANDRTEDFPGVGTVLLIIGVPIVLIVLNTILNSPIFANLDLIILETVLWDGIDLKSWIGLIGHPFVALIIANLVAWYVLGVRRKTDRSKLLDITTRSLGPAGIIILLTGAGGAFKQTLIDTGSGDMIAGLLGQSGMSLFLFAFILAALVRILQGSATVAMITAAGIVAALLNEISEIDKALLVIAIAAGASILSHVNDSGFWLVSKYLGLNEKQTFRSWTVMTTLLSLTGLAMVGLISLFV